MHWGADLQDFRVLCQLQLTVWTLDLRCSKWQKCKYFLWPLFKCLMCVGSSITTNYVSFYELPFNIYFPIFGFLTLLSLSFLYHYFILSFIWLVWWVFFCSLISNYVGFFFFSSNIFVLNLKKKKKNQTLFVNSI